MNPSTFLSILFTLSLIFISHAPLAASTLTFKLYQIVCLQSKLDLGSCLKNLEADPRIPSANTYVELSSLVLELGIRNSTGAQNYLKNLMKTDPSPAIKECANEDYDGIIKAFKNALADVIPDPRTARNYLRRDLNYAEVPCSEAIKNDPKPYFEVNVLLDNVSFFQFIAEISISHFLDL